MNTSPTLSALFAQVTKHHTFTERMAHAEHVRFPRIEFIDDQCFVPWSF